MASSKAASRPLTDGSRLNTPSALLCSSGAVAHTLTSDAGR